MSACLTWWPEDNCYKRNVSEPVNKTFDIVDECTDNTSPSANCVVINGVSMPTALKVKDGAKVYTLDTGSNAAVLLGCANGPLSNRSIAIHYGSETGVNKVLLETQEVLGQTFEPLCNVSGLSQNHQDGLIGISPKMEGQPEEWQFADGPHSYMNQVPEGSRRVVVDKMQNTVCVGSECKRPSGLTEVAMTPLNSALMMPSFIRDGNRYVLDTGSTNSIGYPLGNGQTLCIIGNHEINALDVNYDYSHVAYDVDMEEVDRRCKHRLL